MRERIRAGMKPGELLPTQGEIAAETGASLITVKRAVAELQRAGLVESIRGHGTVVRRTRVDDNHAEVSSFTDNVVGQGAEVRTGWVKIVQRIPPAARARVLKLKARQATVLVRRLRLVDGEPFCLMSNEVVASLVPGLVEKGFSEESFYACLSRYGVKLARADEEVTARASTARERKLLGAKVKIVMVVRRVSFDGAGRPVEVAKLIAPAERYRYQVGLRAGRGT